MMFRFMCTFTTSLLRAMFLRSLATTLCFAQATQPDGALPGSAIQPDETIPSYLAKYGMPVEEHWVTTDDGYILEAFRLPRPSAPVVLMQHGILASAWCWLDNSPSLAPGIQMYHEGYDVWLTNNRGNTYSKNHTTLKPDFNKEFWHFSFADLGRYDVPANIKYILASTGKEQLSYVGWSQGTSQFFVAMSDPEVKSYVEQTVNLFVALSPVTFLAHQQSTLLSLLVDTHIADVLDATFPYGFLDSSALDVAANLLCKLTLGSICEITVDLIAGESSQDTAAAITNLTAHFPAGTSVHALHHYAQLIQNKGFKDFDYGKKGNLEKYGQASPPDFDLTSIGVPTALFVGGSDTMGDHLDVATLTLQLQFNPVLIYNQEFPDFSHMTWLTGTEKAFQTWYPSLLQLVQKYNPVKLAI